MSSVDSIALQIITGAQVVLHRVPRRLTAAECAEGLTALLGCAVSVQNDAVILGAEGPRVVDARYKNPAEFRRWDEQRPYLATPTSPLVVLLDAESSRVLLDAAPHLASWAGGVQLPAEREVRSAQSEEELRLCKNALRRVVHANPWLMERYADTPIAVVLGSDRLFVGLPDYRPEDQARDQLDEGIYYSTRLVEEADLD